MILKNERSKDEEDVGVLLQAIFSYAKANSEQLDRSLDEAGYGKLLALANQAANEVALLHSDEGDLWDGVVWYERMAAVGDESLAAGLFANDDPDVTALVVKWLLSFCWIEFSHDGQRWSFDADELAQWDVDDETFHFHSFHGIAEPTMESMLNVINRKQV